MTMTIIAAVASHIDPLKGESHRSSRNFQLLSNNGNTIVVSCTPGISFDIQQDKSGSDPTIKSGACNGTEIDASKMNTSDYYYIADPKGATVNFVVTLSQDSN